MRAESREFDSDEVSKFASQRMQEPTSQRYQELWFLHGRYLATYSHCALFGRASNLGS